MFKPRLIVVEGADRVGKSSIAQEISGRLGYQYLHFGKPDENKQWAYQYTEIPKENFVLDRSWVSGIFYDTYRRDSMSTGGDKLRMAYLGLFTYMHAKFDIRYVFVTRAWEDCIEAHKLEIAQNMPLSLEERRQEHYDFSIYNAELYDWYRSFLMPNSTIAFNNYILPVVVNKTLEKVGL